MDQIVGVREATQQLDKLVAQVREQGNTVVLLENGEPAAALVPYSLLQKWRRERSDAFAIIDKIRGKNRDLEMTDDEFQAFLDEAVHEARMADHD